MTSSASGSPRPHSDGPLNPQAPLIVLPEAIQTGSGRAVTVPVRIQHRGRFAARLQVTVLGLDADWAPPPLMTEALQPGQDVEIPVNLTPADGALAARYPFVVAAEAIPASGSGQSVLGSAESVLAVDSSERISMSITPSNPTAVFGKRFRVDIVNPGDDDRDFELVPTSAHGILVRLRQRRVTAKAQDTTTVRGRIQVKRPTVIGGYNTHTYALRAQGAGAPEFAEATIRSGPLIRGVLLKIAALVCVIALWAGLAVAYVPKLSDYFKPDSALRSASDLLQREKAGDSATDTPGEDAGDNDGADNSPGAGDPGEDEDGKAEDGDSGSVREGYQLAGVITGPGTAGTTVTLEPKSLMSAAERTNQTSPHASDQTVNTLRALSEGALVKIAGRAAVGRMSTEGIKSLTTTENGQFAFTGMRKTGYYLLTLSQPGFQTERFVINAADLADPEPMEIELQPGAGEISGMVTTSSGSPIGAATVVVSNGDVTLETSSVSSSPNGTAGSWAVDNLPTPGTYLVTATANGYGAASELVELDASGLGTLNLRLDPGQGTITGTISGIDDLGEIGPLGGITVTASDGKNTRTATTVTASDARGTFILPSLPVPGTYTVQTSAEGYLAQTQTISLDKHSPTKDVDATLTRSDGTVEGTVIGVDAAGVPEDGLVGVGLTLSSSTVTLKTMTVSGDSAGSFRFVGVPPGTYVLTAAQFGRIPASVTVEVTSAGLAQQQLTLVSDMSGELPATSRIRGQVVDSRASGPLTCDRAPLAVAPEDCVATISTQVPRDASDLSKGSRTVSVTTTAALDYVYTLPGPDDTESAGLPPGLYKLTVSAPGYEASTVNVQVGQGVTVPVPPTSLPVLGMISGAISTRMGIPAQPSCVLAIPEKVGIPTPLPNSCTTSGNVDRPSCTVPGLGSAYPCAVTSMGGPGKDPAGTYKIRGLEHGRYQVLLISQDPEYRHVSSAAPIVELDLGGDAQFNEVLDRLGRANVLVLGVDASTGLPEPVGGATVTISPAPALAGATLRTDAQGRVTIRGLDGTYTVSANGLYGDASESNLTVGVNQNQPVTLVLTQPIGAVVGQVVGVVDGVEKPLGGVTVTLSGTVGFVGQDPVPGTVTITTDARGCYAVVPPEWNANSGPALTSTDCPTAVHSASVQKIRLVTQAVSAAVDVGAQNVDSPGTVNFRASVGTPGRAGTLDKIRLSASPVPFGTQLASTQRPSGSSVRLDWDSARATVTRKPALAGAVTLTAVDPGGGGNYAMLSFKDSNLSDPNTVVPGRYDFTFSMSGFAPGTATLTCPPGLDLSGSACTMSSLTVPQFPQLTGEIRIPAPLPDGADPRTAVTVSRQSAPGGAGGASVTLGTAVPLDGTGDVIIDGSAPTTWKLPIVFHDPQFQSLGAGNGLAAPGTYQFEVSAPGYTNQHITVVCGAHFNATPSGGTSTTVTTGCTTLDATLGALPRFAGTVQLTRSLLDTDIIDDPAFSDLAIQVVGRPTITVTVVPQPNGSGSLVWKDPNLPEGVIGPGTYSLKFEKPGYRGFTTAPFTCAPPTTQTQTCGPALIQLNMLPVGGGVVTVDQTPPGAPVDWSNATVEVTSGPANKNLFQVWINEDSGNADQALLTWADEAVPDNYPGVIRTGTYHLRISVPGYATATVTAQCDDVGGGAVCEPDPVVLQLRPRFSGSISAKPGASDLSSATFDIAGGPSGISGVKLAAAFDGTLTWVETKNGVDQPANVVTPTTSKPYRVTARFSDYVPVEVEFSCTAVNDCDLPEIVLQARSTLRLEIIDQESDEPVTGALLKFEGNTFRVDSSSNEYEHGQQLDPSRENYTATIQAAGYAFVTVSKASTNRVECTHAPGSVSDVQTVQGLQVLAGGITVCTVKLSRLGVIAGQTAAKKSPTSSSTEALAGVVVTATKDQDTFTATSDNKGRLRITGTEERQGLAAGVWSITASHAGYKNLVGTVLIEAGTYTLASGGDDPLTIDNGVLQLILEPEPVTAHIHLLNDASNDSLPPSTVKISNDVVTLSCVIEDNASTSTCFGNAPGDPLVSGVVDSGGDKYVRFTPLYPGIYTLTVDPNDEDSGNVVLFVQVLPSSGSEQHIYVSVSTVAATMTGAVAYDDSGPVVAGARVYLTKNADPNTGGDPANKHASGSLDTTTDANGEFTLTSIGNGVYYLVVEAAGYSRYKSTTPMSVSAQSNSNIDQGTIELAAYRSKPSVAVTLNLPTGLTPTVNQIRATQESSPPSTPMDTNPVTPTSYAEGIATFSALPTGTWRVEIAGAAGAPFTLEATSHLSFNDTPPNDLELDFNVAAAQLSVQWTAAACVAAPSGTLATTLEQAPDSSVPVTLTVAGTPATTTLYLPKKQFTWSLDSTPTGWDSSGPATFTAGTGPNPTLNLSTRTDTVHLAVTLDGTAASPSFAKVTATCQPVAGASAETKTANLDSGGAATLSLATGASWDYQLTAITDPDAYECTGPDETNQDGTAASPYTFDCLTKAVVTVTVGAAPTGLAVTAAVNNGTPQAMQQDPDGDFVLPSVYKGDKVVVTASATGYEDASYTFTALTGGNNPHTFTSLTPKTGDVTITVRNSDNSLLVSAAVDVTVAPAAGTCGDTTNNVGVVTCTGLPIPDGPYTITVTSNGHSGSATGVQPGGTEEITFDS